MIAKYYNRHYTIDTLRQLSGFNREGVSLHGISETAEKIGFRTRGASITYDQLKGALLPCILYWNQSHFVVLLSVGRNRIKIADPASGIVTMTKQAFLGHWISGENDEGEHAGVILLLEPTPKFYEAAGENQEQLNWGIILRYLTQSKWQITQVAIALLIGAILQLIFPFLTQSIVDNGINTQNVTYITVVLVAQLMLTFSRTVIDFIRSRLLLRISSILNISILSDFWIKLTRLPLSYFERYQAGDTLQRINDHRQVQQFLTTTALSTVFSVFNITVFAVVLAIYSMQIFLVFMAGSVLYFLWIRFFLRIRRSINYKTFHVSAQENNATLQLVQGMQEIRLNNAETVKRWEWENIQASLFKLNFKVLDYNQWQQTGALLINQSKDLIITFFVAKLVIDGYITLGAMLAIQYVIGQLSSPIEQWVTFIQQVQDTRISIERLNEVHSMKDEEPTDKLFLSELPTDRSIRLKDVNFIYPGGNKPVLEDINLQIPAGKVTAIVGTSGSGKTTLLKLLLGFYDKYEGDIKIGTTNIRYISPSFWRSQCGTVLQGGFIFNDNIFKNIAVGDETVNYAALINSCKTANILSFIDTLPNGFHTQLGANGVGLSQGQMQRLLIARAVYKDPAYLFFDEATNALDSNNEKEIIENLNSFFNGRTVVVVAHRLSTVRNADKIVVVDEGRIVEEGTHTSLSALKGKYYELVKNQLNLGK